jgi:hypothetical protein
MNQTALSCSRLHAQLQAAREQRQQRPTAAQASTTAAPPLFDPVEAPAPSIRHRLLYSLIAYTILFVSIVSFGIGIIGIIDYIIMASLMLCIAIAVPVACVLAVRNALLLLSRQPLIMLMIMLMLSTELFQPVTSMQSVAAAAVAASATPVATDGALAQLAAAAATGVAAVRQMLPAPAAAAASVVR